MSAPLTFMLVALLASPVHAAPFVVCQYGQPASACVYDGDTFWLAGEKVRPMGYDAPEIGGPLCKRPAPLAKAARTELLQLLNGGTVRLEGNRRDKYHRRLARVTVDGRDIAPAMIGAGLARRYVPGEAPWC